MRFFNTEGPNRADDHYCLSPLQRWNLGAVLILIDQKKYFLLHAPRQTGKTTYLLALMEHLNREGRYRALYVNIEAAQAARERVEAGMAAVVQVRQQRPRAVTRRRCRHFGSTGFTRIGGIALGEVPEEERSYLIDLSLLRRDDGSGGLVIANPTYREVLPRALASGPQDSLPRITPTWLNADGSLNSSQLLEAFLRFWRQHGQPLLGSAPYYEIAPPLCQDSCPVA
ncbi:hypothetical protein CCP3SC15_1810001 [Gammaproteobacteria bacterium]